MIDDNGRRIPPPLPTPSQPPVVPGAPLPNIPGFAQGDPSYQAALAAYNTALANAASQLKAQQEQQLIAFGDPRLAQGLNLDPAAVAAIQANSNAGNSVLARLQQQDNLSKQAILNRLAAHGLTNSGDLGYLQGQEAQNYGHSLYDAQQQALGALNTLQQNYQNQQGNLRDTLNNALQTSYNTYLTHPYLYTGNGSSTPAPAAPKPPAAPSLPRPAAPKPPSLLQARLSSNPTQGVFSVH